MEVDAGVDVGEETQAVFCCHLCQHGALVPVGNKDNHPIVRCAACGLAQTHPMPDDASLADYYRHYHGNANKVKHHQRKLRLWKRKLWPLLIWQRKGRFLDIGCSVGFTAEAARQLGWQAHGHDLSQEAIALARGLFPDCAFSDEPLAQASMLQQSYDMVTASEVIEHVNDLQGFLASLGRLVKVGGYLYLTTPDAGRFKNDADFLAWKEVCPPHHLLWLNHRQLRDALRQAGFELVVRFPVLKPSLRVLARRV